MRKLSWLCLVLLGVVELHAQDPAARRYSPWPDYPADVVQRGQEQFQKTCAFCHGTNATGGSSGPSLMQSAVVRHDEKGELLAPVVRQGRPDKGMPAFPFNDAQIADVSVFLHARLKASDLKSAGKPNEQYSLDKLLVGKADAGKVFFNGAGRCSSCHSTTGDLAGVAGKYAPIDLQSRFLYPQDQHATATVTDSSGKQQTGVILLLTNYDVALRDAEGEYHSWPLDAVKLKMNDRLAAHLELLSKYTDAEMHDVFAYLETLK